MLRTIVPLNTVAYFSMEVGLHPDMPTYSGGLGILAGDTLKAAADLGVPMIGITLLHRKGYFLQHLNGDGSQGEDPATWEPEKYLEPLPQRVTVPIEGRAVTIRAWRFTIRGVSDNTVPVLFLDTDLPENDPQDRTITDHLYGGDNRYRLVQETILGIGGVNMLRELGYEDIQAYHMNEGHSALLTLALLEEQIQTFPPTHFTMQDREAVRSQCVFTTHTPVPAGTDKFSLDLVQEVLGKTRAFMLSLAECWLDSTLNMTYLALFFSRYINGVAMRHGEISRHMYSDYSINAITNGVHAVTWTSDPLRNLFDSHFPEWRRDNLYLRYAISIPLEDIRAAHAQAKYELLAKVEEKTGVQLDPEVMTIGFARRATAYKRADLIFSDVKRLKSIARKAGRFQLIYGGKAHPKDEGGKELIRHIFSAAEDLKNDVRVVYLEEYDMGMARYICSGVDLWLNTPLKPHEASGTSGMKAALNGVPSLSVLDGWWIEGHVEGVTGWRIGEAYETESNPEKEVESLYQKLAGEILPMFYRKPLDYARIMRWAIALNGSFFNTQRMILQYLENAYLAR